MPSNPASPTSLQLLSVEPLRITRKMLAESLKELHSSLQSAAVELTPVSQAESAVLVQGDGPPACLHGTVSWGNHAVKLLGFDAPLPPGPISGTLDHSLFVTPAARDVGRTHIAHVLLYYAGKNSDSLEQHVAVAAVAAALAPLGCVVTLNEEARTAVNTSALLADEGEDLFEVLRTLPVPFLYGGLTKIELTDPPGQLWFRTFAAHRFGLPDLARPGTGHDQFSATFQLFASLLSYLRQTGLRFTPGEAIRVDEDRYFNVRVPTPEEWWLDSQGEMLVLTDTK